MNNNILDTCHNGDLNHAKLTIALLSESYCITVNNSDCTLYTVRWVLSELSCKWVLKICIFWFLKLFPNWHRTKYSPLAVIMGSKSKLTEHNIILKKKTNDISNFTFWMHWILSLCSKLDDFVNIFLCTLFLYVQSASGNSFV